ncbi:MAG: hypothetical protein Q8Q26_19575 [Pseudorhodobacter sp.]|nr:hypothetical protein [Pseudorhodobacter sp.]
MSRLTDLIARAKAKDPALGDELDREFKALASRRAFGLNFERHKPESVELPGREVRRGDKVHVLPLRGSTTKGDQRLWRVLRLEGAGKARMAHLALIDAAEPETAEVPVADLVVVAEFRDYIYPGLVSTGKVTRGGDKPSHGHQRRELPRARGHDLHAQGQDRRDLYRSALQYRREGLEIQQRLR